MSRELLSAQDIADKYPAWVIRIALEIKEREEQIRRQLKGREERGIKNEGFAKEASKSYSC